MNKRTPSSFAKYVGCGNDFVLFDNRNLTFPCDRPDFVKKLCHRQLGIGADGILLLELSEKADVRMRIFNADGSEAEMCGNGLRCFVTRLKTLGFEGPLYRIETKDRILTARTEDRGVCVDMGPPEGMEWNISIDFFDQGTVGHYLNTGVPHLVIFVDDLEEVDVEYWGRTIRHHSRWSPGGTNVNFAKVLSKQKMRIRTFERGVEAETLACGTGATAAVLAAGYFGKVLSPVSVETKSGEDLIITYTVEDQKFSKVEMAGPAYCVFEGELDWVAYLSDKTEVMFDSLSLLH